MRVDKRIKTISVSELVERIKLSKNEKKLNVALVDQNFLKRNEEKFVATQNQEYFLLKTKIGSIQRRAVIEVFVNGIKASDYQ